MSLSLLAALAVMAVSQLFKLARYSIRDGRFRLSHLLSTGGMPSAHSAFVTTLAVSVGLWRGLGSEVFAVSAVFGSIIVYDSIRLRGTVDIHTRILRDLQSRIPASADIRIPRWVGHSVAETAVGIAVGGVAAVALYLGLRGVFPRGVLE
jgi:hypothetical protein